MHSAHLKAVKGIYDKGLNSRKSSPSKKKKAPYLSNLKDNFRTIKHFNKCTSHSLSEHRTIYSDPKETLIV